MTDRPHSVRSARQLQREQETLRVEEQRNARQLARDAMLYGTNFVDVTGRRIDPTRVRPSEDGESA